MDIESDNCKKPQNLITKTTDENLSSNIQPKPKEIDLACILRQNLKENDEQVSVSEKKKKPNQNKKSESKYFVLDEDIRILSVAFYYQKYEDKIVLKTLIDQLSKQLLRSSKSVTKRFDKMRFLNDSQKYLLVSYYEKYKSFAKTRRIIFHKNEVDAVLITINGLKLPDDEANDFELFRSESYEKRFVYTLKEEDKRGESVEEVKREYIPHGLLVDGCFSVDSEDSLYASEKIKQFKIDPVLREDVIDFEDLLSIKEEGEVDRPLPKKQPNQQSIALFEIDEPSLIVQACFYRPKSFYTSKDILNITLKQECIQKKRKKIEKKKKQKRVYMQVDLDEFISQGKKMLKNVFLEKKKVLDLEQLLEQDCLVKDGKVDIKDVESRFAFDRHSCYLSN